MRIRKKAEALVSLFVIFILLIQYGCVQKKIKEEKFKKFEKIIETFRKDLKVPGMSAVILKDQKVVWAKGFGYADLEKKVAVTPETPFHLASATKPIGAVIMLQLVEEGVLDLEDPFSKYGMDLDSAVTIRLKHLFTHTSEGVPGTYFNYNGNRYGYLGIAMKKASESSFKNLTNEKILKPLNMINTVPNLVDPEILVRFFDYMKEKDNFSPIYNDNGELYKLCSLYEYRNSLYGKTYQVASNLVAEALDKSGIDSSQFFVGKELTIDEQTKDKFVSFWQKDTQYVEIYKKLAKPYDLDSVGNIVLGKYSMFFNPAAGFISSTMDLAEFDIALDKNRLISKETKEKAFTPTESSKGEKLPYGLGWFTQEYKGVRLKWHGGEWYCISALYLKVPDENLTLIILANARSMSQAFNMGEGNVLNSGVGLEFLRLFVFEEKFGEIGPDINWKALPGDIVKQIDTIENEDFKGLYRKQLRNMETMFLRMGPSVAFHNLVNEVHRELLSDVYDRRLEDFAVFAKIDKMRNNEHKTKDFDLDWKTDIHIYSIGECSQGKEFDYGWIENLRTGELVWQMKAEKSQHAGGANKNRKIDEVISLQDDVYRLHYKTDDSHSYDNWNAAPPDHIFWGILLYEE